jgi:hypothetical protein
VVVRLSPDALEEGAAAVGEQRRNVADGAYPPYTRAARVTRLPRTRSTSERTARGTFSHGGLGSAPVRDMAEG